MTLNSNVNYEEGVFAQTSDQLNGRDQRDRYIRLIKHASQLNVLIHTAKTEIPGTLDVSITVLPKINDCIRHREQAESLAAADTQSLI